MSQDYSDGFWVGYYEALTGRGPRPLLLDALKWCGSPSTKVGRLAIDLGSGDGTETLELLRRGWRVLAIDQEPDAMARLDRLCHPSIGTGYKLRWSGSRKCSCPPPTCSMPG